jgi:hypothetical protein
MYFIPTKLFPLLFTQIIYRQQPQQEQSFPPLTEATMVSYDNPYNPEVPANGFYERGHLSELDKRLRELRRARRQRFEEQLRLAREREVRQCEYLLQQRRLERELRRNEARNRPPRLTRSMVEEKKRRIHKARLLARRRRAEEDATRRRLGLPSRQEMDARRKQAYRSACFNWLCNVWRYLKPATTKGRRRRRTEVELLQK